MRAGVQRRIIKEFLAWLRERGYVIEKVGTRPAVRPNMEEILDEYGRS